MLSSLVAAPNVLAALGNHGVIPRGKFLAKESKGGTPRNAMLINGIIVGCALLLGDLNKVAALITMFFLITYATLNIVVLIEQSLGLVSFRPTFKVHILVPAIGTVCSIFAMIITNPAFGLFALSVVFGIYVYLEYRHLETPWETVRSGVFLAVADWAARKTQLKSEAGSERAWKPDVVVPIENARESFREITDSFYRCYHRKEACRLFLYRKMNRFITKIDSKKSFNTIATKGSILRFHVLTQTQSKPARRWG